MRYVSLENPDIREFALLDPKGFLEEYGDRLIIDEIQYVPKLFSYIKERVDNNKKVKYLITGSNNFLMLENISQTLAGRVAVLKLLPFSIEELTNTRYEKKDYESYIFYGGYIRKAIVQHINVIYSNSNYRPIIKYKFGLYSRTSSATRRIENSYETGDIQNKVFYTKQEAIFRWLKDQEVNPREMLQDFFEGGKNANN